MAETPTEPAPRKRRKWDEPAPNAVAANPALAPAPQPPPQVQPDPVAAAAAVRAAQEALAKINAALALKSKQAGGGGGGVAVEAHVRDLPINDCENRFLLTKGATHDDIHRRTGAVVTTRGAYIPPGSHPHGAPPLDPTAALHLHVTAKSAESLEQAVTIIEGLIAQAGGPVPLRPNQTQVKVWIAVPPIEDPQFNTLQKLKGPDDEFVNMIQKDTGATIQLRGSGSGVPPRDGDPHEGLHFHINSTDPIGLDAAKRLCDDLVRTVTQEYEAFKAMRQSAYLGGMAPAWAAQHPPHGAPPPHHLPPGAVPPPHAAGMAAVPFPPYHGGPRPPPPGQMPPQGPVRSYGGAPPPQLPPGGFRPGFGPGPPHPGAPPMPMHAGPMPPFFAPPGPPLVIRSAEDLAAATNDAPLFGTPSKPDAALKAQQFIADAARREAEERLAQAPLMGPVPMQPPPPELATTHTHDAGPPPPPQHVLPRHQPLLRPNGEVPILGGSREADAAPKRRGFREKSFVEKEDPMLANLPPEARPSKRRRFDTRDDRSSRDHRGGGDDPHDDDDGAPPAKRARGLVDYANDEDDDDRRPVGLGAAGGGARPGLGAMSGAPVAQQPSKPAKPFWQR